MLGSKILALTSMVLGATALPTERDNGNYTVHVVNNCAMKKEFAAYQIAQPSWTMAQITKTLALDPKKNGTLSIPFNSLGVRVSGDADKGTDAQWQALELVEFGYSAFMGLIGTAFDLSMMGGTSQKTALKVCPVKTSSTCQCKVNDPNLPMSQKLSQVWDTASRVLQGSPADTTCMGGKQDFIITWC